jgi:hypothetical protein
VAGFLLQQNAGSGGRAIFASEFLRVQLCRLAGLLDGQLIVVELVDTDGGGGGECVSVGVAL